MKSTVLHKLPFISSADFFAVCGLFMYRLKELISKHLSVSKLKSCGAMYLSACFETRSIISVSSIKKLGIPSYTPSLPSSMIVDASAVELAELSSWQTTSLDPSSGPDGWLTELLLLVQLGFSPVPWQLLFLRGYFNSGGLSFKCDFALAVHDEQYTGTTYC